jgi:Fur family transcriptional regulator, ferric uptake regulator
MEGKAVSTRELDHSDAFSGAVAPALRSRQAGPSRAELSAAVALVRERGLRVSAARRLVLEALLAADGPMSAEQIATGIGGRVPASDIGSVYRNLQAFEEIGVVRHVHLGHGPGLHALAVTGEREYLTCERCADFRAVQPEELDAVRDLVESRFGYRPRFTHFPIVGLCPSCVAAVGSDPRGSGTDS